MWEEGKLGSCEEGEGEKEGSREGGAVEGEEERTFVGWVEEGRESWKQMKFLLFNILLLLLR